MRKIFIGVIILGGIFSNLLIAQGNFFRQYQAADNRGDRSTALKQIEAAYKKDPKNALFIYWYAVELFKHERFEDARVMLEKVPASFLPGETRFRLALTHYQLGDSERSFSIWEELWEEEKLSPVVRRETLFTYLEKILEKDELGRFESRKASILRYLGGLDKKDKTASQIREQGMLMVGKILFRQIWWALAAADIKTLETLYRELGLLYRDELALTRLQISLKDAEVLLEAGRFAAKNPDQKALLTHRMKICVLGKVKKLREFQGTSQLEEFLLDRNFVEKRLVPALKSLDHLLSFYTRGQLRLRWEITDWSQREVTLEYEGESGEGVFLPRYESLSPYPGREILSSINQVDSYFFISPYPVKKPSSRAGLFYPFYVPDFFRAELSRGRLELSSTQLADPGHLIQEFYRFAEYVYELPRPQNFLQVNSIHWPGWYKGEGELFYYMNAFEKQFRSWGFKRLLPGQKKTALGEATVSKMEELSKKYPLAVKRQAWELFGSALKLKKRGSHMDFESKIKAAQELMPDNPHFIREEANWRYWHKKEYGKAYELLLKTEKLVFDDCYTIQMLAVSARVLGKIPEAIDWYEKLLPLTEEKALPLYRLGVLYYQQQNYGLAQERFAQYIRLDEEKKELAEAMRLSGYILIVKDKNYPRFVEQIKPYLNQLLYWRTQRNTLAYYTGVALGMSGDKKEALRWLNTARSWGYPHKENLDYYVKLFQ